MGLTRLIIPRDTLSESLGKHERVHVHAVFDVGVTEHQQWLIRGET